MFGKNKEIEKTEGILSEITQKRTEVSPSVNFSSLIRTMKKDLIRAEKGDFSLISFEEKSKNSQVTDNKDQKEEISPFFTQVQKTPSTQIKKEEDFASPVQQSKPQLKNVDTQSSNNVNENTYGIETLKQSSIKSQVSQTSAIRPDISSLTYQQEKTTSPIVSSTLNTTAVTQDNFTLNEKVKRYSEIEKQPVKSNIFSVKNAQQDQGGSQLVSESLKKEAQENKPADVRKLSFAEVSLDPIRKENNETSGQRVVEGDKNNTQTDKPFVIDAKRGEVGVALNISAINKDLTAPEYEAGTQGQKIEDRPGILNQSTFISHGLDVKPKTLPITNTIEKQDNNSLVFDTKKQKLSSSNFFKENFNFGTNKKKLQSKSDNSAMIPNDEFSFGISKKSETNEAQAPLEKNILDLPKMNMEVALSAEKPSNIVEKKENGLIPGIEKVSTQTILPENQKVSLGSDLAQMNSSQNLNTNPVSGVNKREPSPSVEGIVKEDKFSPFVRKVFSYSFLLIFSILFFGGGYYAWNEFDMKVYLGLGEKKEENEIPILPPIIPEEKEEVKPVVYSPNVVNSIQTNRSSFSGDLQKIGDFTANASVGSSFQFRFEDVNSQPLALSELFASLSHTIDVMESASWSLVASHESYGVRYGLIITTNTASIADNVKKNLELSGSMLIKDLYEIGITLPTSYTFRSGSYNDIPVRFHNIDGAQNYSFDYIFKDSTLVIGTSKESVRSTYDISLRK